jgi:hypothetical protein
MGDYTDGRRNSKLLRMTRGTAYALNRERHHSGAAAIVRIGSAIVRSRHGIGLPETQPVRPGDHRTGHHDEQDEQDQPAAHP